jgi:hypothetical protein
MERPLISHATLTAANAVTGGGVSVEELTSAELELGVNIVGEYRKFLRTMGWLSSDNVEIFGLGADAPKHLRLVAIAIRERMEMYPPLPRELLPITNDGSGNLYCVHHAGGTMLEPEIVFWDHQLGSKQKPLPVAPSFSVWAEQALSGLSTN